MQYYELIPIESDIEQGDIFKSLPFLRLESTKFLEIKVQDATNQAYIERDLLEMMPTSNSEYANVLSQVTFRPAIIISQSCDLLRDEYVSYCEIVPFKDMDKEFAQKSSPKSKVEFITKYLKNKDKYFYLPENIEIGFPEKMAVNFASMHQLKRTLLADVMQSRSGRLSSHPIEHFRKKISYYFSRFAYDPWYPLNKDEFGLYINDQSPEEQRRIPAYPWQAE